MIMKHVLNELLDYETSFAYFYSPFMNSEKCATYEKDKTLVSREHLDLLFTNF